jgi:CRISPR/Cas system CSM-associated protein Csm2 small subunit
VANVGLPGGLAFLDIEWQNIPRYLAQRLYGSWGEKIDREERKVALNLVKEIRRRIERKEPCQEVLEELEKLLRGEEKEDLTVADFLP